MTQQIADRIKELSTTTGTGPFTLAGAAAGYRQFSAVCSVNDTVYYTIEGLNVDGSLTGEWEVGLGTYSAANTLTRTTVLASSNAGVAVGFSAGNKQVFVDLPASQIAAFAPLTSPAFGGTPTAPVAALDSATTQIATCSFVLGQANGANPIMDSVAAPGTSTRWARGDHVHPSDTSRLAASAYTAADVLAKLLTVDGVGSGLDADSVDGLQASAFAQLSGASFTGEIGVKVAAATSAAITLAIPSGAATTVHGINGDLTAASTATAALFGIKKTLRTAAAAFTLAAATFFSANAAALGAGSTITTVKGFEATNSIAVGTNNYGFYSSINAAANTWQLRMAGTAESFFGGSVSVSNAGANQLYMLGVNGTHANSGVTLYGIQADITAPSTNTTNLYVVRALGRTAAAAFTLGQMVFFMADTPVLGASSTITNIKGFYAPNNLAGKATNTYGFFSDIAAASATFQLSLQGTAASRFGGPVYHAQDNSTTQAVSALWQGTGAPNNSNGNNGDFYLRGDTPGTANQRLYVKSAGAWVGIL